MVGMIKALNSATQGLLQAERRATDIAKDILKTASGESGFSVEDPSETTKSAGQSLNTATPPAPQPNGEGFGNLIQQFADLRAEENSFKASATAFKKIDEALGTLLDDKS